MRKGSVRWTTPGQTDATHPQAKFGGNLQSHQTSTRFLENGSYLRLRNVTVGYNLPASWLKKASINAARLYVSGDNLFTATKFSGVDPEVDLTGGISSFRYPTSRRFVFGVNLTF
ncbi:TonB dependent receptor [compost metagenome]